MTGLVLHRMHPTILKGISISSPPTKTVYLPGEVFSNIGMLVTAEYNHGGTSEITNYLISPSGEMPEGTSEVTITYTENGISYSVTQPITVERGVISVPAPMAGGMTYNGSTITPRWFGYDSSKMIIGGATSAINAGTYTTTFTPTHQYKWTDGSTGTKNVNWTINKATGYLDISPSTINLDSSNTSDIITVTRYGDGLISAESQDTSVATVSVNGNIVTVQGTGTDGQTIIMISVAEGTNYTDAPSVLCIVTASYFKVGTTIVLDAGSGTWTCPVSGQWEVEGHGGGGGGRYGTRSYGGKGGGGSGDISTIYIAAGEDIYFSIGGGGKGMVDYKSPTIITQGSNTIFGELVFEGASLYESKGSLPGGGTPPSSSFSGKGAYGNRDKPEQTYGNGGNGGRRSYTSAQYTPGGDGKRGGIILTYLG